MTPHTTVNRVCFLTFEEDMPLPPSNLDLEKSSRPASASRLIGRLWRRQNCLLDHYCIFYPLGLHTLANCILRKTLTVKAKIRKIVQFREAALRNKVLIIRFLDKSLKGNFIAPLALIQQFLNMHYFSTVLPTVHKKPYSQFDQRGSYTKLLRRS